MASVCSPTSLQQACEVAAAAWLVQWSGLVGQVALRASVPQKQTVQEEATLLRGQDSIKSRASTTRMGDTPRGSRRQTTLKTPGLEIQKVTEERPTRTLSRRKLVRIAPVLQYEELQPLCNNTRDTTVKYPPNVVQPILQNNLSHVATCGIQMSVKSSTSIDFCEDIYNCVVTGNVTKCSSFFKTQVPPSLINQILSIAWRLVSQQVALGGRLEAVPEYQVVDWSLRAPVLLRIAGALTCRSFPIDLSGVPETYIDAIIADISKLLPHDNVNKLVLPKTKFKSCKSVVPKCQNILLDFLQKTNLVSLTLHSELCDDKSLNIISGLSLRELDIGSSSVTDEGVINKFCGLPFESGDKALEALKHCKYSYSPTHLSKYLRKLSMSFHNISSSVYHLILGLFSELQFYNPHKDIKSCIRECARLSVPQIDECTSPRKLNLLKINLGHASRAEILEMSRICPSVREVSLHVELSCEETLDALESFGQLSDITLAYYPSFASSPPKLKGSFLLPLFLNFKNQIHSISLTGFNISDKCLHELSQLPELKSLSMADCWLAYPKCIPNDPFSSLENLALQFLPPNSILELLTSGKTLLNLKLDFVASEWEGSALSDTHVKQLVTTGRIASLQSFIATSPYLTLDSVKSLTLLPSLRNVGYLARWGLTEEELHCISHSGPPHLICMH